MKIFNGLINYLNNLKGYQFIILVILINALLMLWVYQGVFSLELQGDTWQYAWAHQNYYGHNVFSLESLKGIRTSLGGASLTFGLIENHFGLNPLVFYSIAVFIKFLTVLAFYFLALKLSRNRFASLIASAILAVSFVGIEATHWVFNMYANIGLLFVILSVLTAIDLPEKFTFRRWLVSFLLACVGIWYATMRTNGIIIIILAFSIYKFITLRSKSSKSNLVAWIIGFVVFILIDKFLLGQMETAYTQYYIIGQGLQAFQNQLTNFKYDFFLSPAANLGAAIFPDVTWTSFDFPKTFSFLGTSRLKTVIIPSFVLFSFISYVISTAVNKRKNIEFNIGSSSLFLFLMGLLWTLLIFLISKMGPQNFPSWETLAMALFGGYFLAICLFLVMANKLPDKLNNLFFITFFWSFVFLLLPLFQNGGPIFGTYHRYMVATAVAVPLFLAGIMSLGFFQKSNSFRMLTFIVILMVFFFNAARTKAFFDRKAGLHNRQVASRVWQQFTEIVPNKAEYAKDNPPIIWFETADNAKDSETLFETLLFGFLFKVNIKYNWDPHSGTALFYQNYPDLVKKIKEDPKQLDKFYGVRMENQSLVDVTDKTKQRILAEITQ